MRLYFKQRFFSWFDSYDIFDDSETVIYTVKGVPSWGHCLHIYDAYDNKVGTVKEEILTFLPKFAMYVDDQYVGQIKKEFTFFKPKFTLDCNGWEINGDFWQWEYDVLDRGRLIMHASKEFWHFTDFYVLDVEDPRDQLYALMIVLAIDAAKCSSGD